MIGAGGVFAGTNPSYTHFELSHHIKTARVTFLISEPEILDNLLLAAKDNDVPTTKVWVFNTDGRPLPPGRQSWTDLLNYGEEDWVRFDDLDTCKNTTAARLFSSGTTGLPKAAVISHYNLIAQHELVFEVQKQPYEVRSPSVLNTTMRMPNHLHPDFAYCGGANVPCFCCALNTY